MDFSTTKKQTNSSQATSSNMANKYCSSCGQQSSDDARFCPSCGSPGHEMPQVPEQGANVPTSSPYRQPPRGAPPSSETLRPKLVLVGMCFIFGFLQLLLGMAGSPKQDVGYVIGHDLGAAIGGVIVLVVLTLIVGGGVYLYYRFRRGGTTFGRALFSWPVVIIVGCLALVSFVGS